MTREISNSDDILDVRDVIKRFEELTDQKADTPENEWSDGDEEELTALASLLDELKGYGGDEQWRGDLYPITLIRDDYFTEYAQELLEDCGDLPRDLPSYIEIDWEATARNIRQDYSSVEVGNVTYWYR